MEPRVLARFVKLMALGSLVLFVFWAGYRYLNPSAPGDYEVRQGDILLSDGRFEKARERFEAALAKTPDHRGALMGRGIAALQLGRLEAAETDFTSLIDAGPGEDDATSRGVLAAAFANRGILRDRSGRHEEALEDYIEAVRLDLDLAEGPGVLDRILRGGAEPSSVVKRAKYLLEQFELPPAERILTLPEADSAQRMYRP